MSENSQGPSREEIALVEVGRTVIGAGTARFLTVSFISLLILIPSLDGFVQWHREGIEGVRALSLLRHPPDVTSATFPIHRLHRAQSNPLHDFESDVENASWIRSWCQQRLQTGLVSLLHVGNSKVVLGEGDWLFYRDGIDHLVNPGFLGPSHQRNRIRSMGDSRPAIVRFHRECQAAGARLVLLPIADKAQIETRFLAPDSADGGWIDNPDYAQWESDLAQAGVVVLPTSEVLRKSARAGAGFLRQDTHWTPAAMDAVAEMVAERLALPSDPSSRHWVAGKASVMQVGDLVGALRLPVEQTAYLPQSVDVAPVMDAETGKPWSSDENADVLLLGDSFTNIYSDPSLKWGVGAGFGPRLALHLGRGVDVVAINGQGATGARRELSKRAAPLKGKRIVIWEFAVRDLSVADWAEVDMSGKPRPSSDVAEVEVDVVLTATSVIKSPGMVPYTEALTTLKGRVLRVGRGHVGTEEVLMVVPCMKDNGLLPSARLRTGDVIRVALAPWNSVSAEERRKNTYDDTDEMDLDRWWVSEWSPK